MLLTLEPGERADGSHLRTLPLFDHLSWTQEILNVDAPFLPQPKDHTDTTYFQARNSLQNLRVSQTDFWFEKVNGSLKQLYFYTRKKERKNKNSLAFIFYFNPLTRQSSRRIHGITICARKKNKDKKKRLPNIIFVFFFFVYMFLHLHILNKQKEYIYCKWKSACGKAKKSENK